MKKKGDRQVPKCVPVSEQEMEEDLKKWFKEKWVRFGPDGKIRGDCARGSSKEGKPKCLPQSKAHGLGKKGRASAAAKKRREDPDPERRGAAKNVATKVKEDDMDEGWKQNMAAGILGATMALSPVPARAEIANMSPVQVQQSIKRAELTKLEQERDTILRSREPDPNRLANVNARITQTKVNMNLIATEVQSLQEKINYTTKSGKKLKPLPFV
jgi:hypothetical protein